MKAIKRSKCTKATKAELDKLREEIHLSNEVKYNWICGPDFVAVELTLNALTSQAVAVTHWRDKHNPELGRNIALGRAVLRLAIKLYNAEAKVESSTLEVLPTNKTFAQEINEKVQDFKVSQSAGPS